MSEATTSTPVSGRSGRLRRRLRDSPIAPMHPRRFLDEDDEDYDDEVPASQFQPGRDAEIFWNMEASPQVQEQLRRRLAEVDANSPNAKKSPPPETSPLLSRKTRLKPRRPQAVDHAAAKDMMASMKELCNKVCQEGVEREGDEVEVQTGQDVFENSVDDSFLLRCSQAVDAKPAKDDGDERKTRAASTEKDASDPFDDDDDSFDLLMSQLPTDALVKHEKEDARPHVKEKKSLRSDPPVKTTSNLAIRRFRTTEDHVRVAPATSSALSRNHSTPEVSSSTSSDGTRSLRTKTKIRCSQDEIERKKEEAKRKRRQIEMEKKKRAGIARK